MVTSRKDVEPWWEAMIECASNTYQSSLRELHFIDRLPPLSPNPPAALCCLSTNKWHKHTSQASSSGNFYWFDLCSLFLLVWKRALQGNCSYQLSRCCVCALLSHLCSGMLMYLIHLHSVEQPYCLLSHIFSWLAVVYWATSFSFLNFLSAVCAVRMDEMDEDCGLAR